MAGTLREVVDAATELGRVYRALSHAREEEEKQLENLTKRWVSDHAMLLEDETDDDDEYGELESAIGEYLTSELAGEVLPDWIREILREQRPIYLAEIEASRTAVQETHAAVHLPHHAFVRQLKAWFDAAQGGETEGAALQDWPEILTEWRRALDKTTREAGEALAISSSAVVRYEQGTRSPSLPYLASMIDRMAKINTVTDEAPFRPVLRSVARLFGDRDATEMFEQGFAPYVEREREAREELEQLLDGLELGHLEGLISLAKSPAALDALRSWASQPPLDLLQPVREALGALGAPSSDDGGVPR